MDLSVVMSNNGAFWAFGNKQFLEKRQEGVDYVSLGGGLICPKDTAKKLAADLKALSKKQVEDDLAANSRKDIIWRELANYECQIVGTPEDAVDALKRYGITEEEVKAQWGAYMQHCIDQDLF